MISNKSKLNCDWNEFSLEELGEFARGKSKYRPRDAKELYGGQYPFIQTGDIKDANLYVEKYSKTYNEFGLSQSKLWKKDTLCITIAANIAETAILKFDACFPDSVVGFQEYPDKSDVYFMHYLFCFIKNKIQKATSGSVQDNINLAFLKKLRLRVPNINIQKKIANILLSLDKKIELNNEMNKTLEEMAQALFKRWFVDFEFPNEEGKPYKSSGGEMADSEMGMIPSGWRVICVSDVIDIKDGTHASPKPKEKGYPLITSKHISGDKIDFNSANLISKEDYDEVNKRSKVDTGDILISMIGTVGLIHLIQEEQINFAIKNVGLFKSSKKRELSEYLYLFLKSNQMKNYIESRLAGTTQKYISLGELRKIKFILPNENILNRFNIIAKNIFDKKRNNIEKIDTLIEIRDSLLLKLMSGEIIVNEIEASL